MKSLCCCLPAFVLAAFTTDITLQAKANRNWGCTFVGPGNDILPGNGKLVFPARHSMVGGGQGRVFFVYSSDPGDTWQVSPDVTAEAMPNWTGWPGGGELTARSGQCQFTVPLGGSPGRFVRIRALAY